MVARLALLVSARPNLHAAQRWRHNVVGHVAQVLVEARHVELLVVSQHLLFARVLLKVGLELLRVEQLVLDLLDARLLDRDARDRAQDVAGSVPEAFYFVHAKLERLEENDRLGGRLRLVAEALLEVVLHQQQQVLFALVDERQRRALIRTSSRSSTTTTTTTHIDHFILHKHTKSKEYRANIAYRPTR